MSPYKAIASLARLRKRHPFITLASATPIVVKDASDYAAVFCSSRTTGGGFVTRLTKSDLEKALLAGAAVPWADVGGKPATIQIATAKQRRLFALLLNSNIRDVKGLPQAFIDGLAAAYVAAGDPNPSISCP